MTSVVDSLHKRIAQLVVRPVRRSDAVAIGLLASLRDAEAMLCVMYGRNLVNAVLTDEASRRVIQLTPIELGALVTVGGEGEEAKRALQQLEVTDLAHRDLVTELGLVLTTTLQPAQCQNAWAHPRTRAAAALAMRMTDPNNAIEALFGTLAKHDRRRLARTTENLQVDEEETNEHILSTCLLVQTFARSVVFGS